MTSHRLKRRSIAVELRGYPPVAPTAHTTHQFGVVRSLARLAEIYMRGSMRKKLWSSIAPEDIYKMAHALSRDLSRACRRAQRDYPSTPPTNRCFVCSLLWLPNELAYQRRINTALRASCLITQPHPHLTTLFLP